MRGLCIDIWSFLMRELCIDTGPFLMRLCIDIIMVIFDEEVVY